MKHQHQSPFLLLSSNERPNNGSRASNPGNQEDVQARHTRTRNSWRVGASSSSNQHSTAAPQAPLAFIIEDGFKVVFRSNLQTAKARICNRSTPSSAIINPRSVAAASRANVYNGPTPNNSLSSHFKQSCLPADERDPGLFEAERNKGTAAMRILQDRDDYSGGSS